MAAGAPEQVPLTFDDIAVHFSEEEWDYLEEWQKDLHKNVMWENYEALTSLGFQVARPVVRLKTKQQTVLHTGAAEATGEARIPNKHFSAGPRLPSRRTSSEVSKTAAEGQENAVECQETAFPRNAKTASRAPRKAICVNAAMVARNRNSLNPAFALRSAQYTPSTHHGVPKCCTSSAVAAHLKSAANPTEDSFAAGVAPYNTRHLKARAERRLRVSGKGRMTERPVEDGRARSNFVQPGEAPSSTLEENVFPRNTVEILSPPRNSEESTSESSSSEESLRPRDSAFNQMSSPRLRKQRSRTPRTMRLLLFQQRKIMRELRYLRRSNEQLQCSIVQVMEEIRRRPENPTTLTTEAGTLPCQEAYLVENTGIVDAELHFINGPSFDTSCQLVAQSAGSQGALNNVAHDNSPYFKSDKHHDILSFNTQQDTSPHIASTPSPCASLQRHTGSMLFDLMAEVLPHNPNGCTSLAESSPRDFPCETISVQKQEPSTASVEPVLRTTVLPFPSSARRGKHGESLPDIPLPHLSLERQAILLRHSRGEPHTLAKFLFQHYVPFSVYESWVHNTNFNGSRNKRAIPRNLRSEIMRFITSRFRLVEEDKKQIRDRINELLRMPRTGGWPVLS